MSHRLVSTPRSFPVCDVLSVACLKLLQVFNDSKEIAESSNQANREVVYRPKFKRFEVSGIA